mgnify:CR=1 FL=1
MKRPLIKKLDNAWAKKIKEYGMCEKCHKTLKDDMYPDDKSYLNFSKINIDVLTGWDNTVSHCIQLINDVTI